MSNTRLYPVFCLERNIEINDLPKMIDWAYANAGSQTVVILNKAIDTLHLMLIVIMAGFGKFLIIKAKDWAQLMLI